jgi:hypothetical protein
LDINDTVQLLIPQPRDGWHYGENEKSGLRGWFPIQYTTKVHKINITTFENNFSSCEKQTAFGPAIFDCLFMKNSDSALFFMSNKTTKLKFDERVVERKNMYKRNAHAFFSHRRLVPPKPEAVFVATGDGLRLGEGEDLQSTVVNIQLKLRFTFFHHCILVNNCY